MQTTLTNLAKVLLLTVSVVGIAVAQDPASKSVRVIGEVTAADGSSLTVKTDTGTTTVMLDAKTVFQRIPPGETDVTKVTRIELKDVGVGDRVRTRSRVGDDQKPGPAVSVLVMSKTDLAKKQESEKLEWQRRGVSGTITAVDAATKEVTLKARVRGESKAVVVEASDKSQYRRYSPDSIRFSDAKPSEFADLKVGDQMRVLGEKNEDGTRIKSEMVVSGSFHNIAGTVSSVDAASGEIKITDLQTKRPVMVKVNGDTTLKKVPQEMGFMLARMAQGGNTVAAPGGAPGTGRPAGAPEGAVRMAPGGPGGGGPGAGGPGGAPGTGMVPGGRIGGGGRGGDFSQMVERMPVFSISELKPGDAIIVATSAGPDPAHVTAITLLSGVEPLLTAPAGQANRQLNASWNFDINIVP
ncbi:MAG: hypothetical protein ABI822_23065 [Bryobacteraceae bacterium]